MISDSKSDNSSHIIELNSNEISFSPSIKNIDFSIDPSSSVTSIVTINIPSHIVSIAEDAFDSCIGLYQILVDPDNAFFTSIDGVLFSKNEKTLICYPQNRLSSRYLIPSSVTSISTYAFRGCKHLQKILVHKSNSSFDSIDGILFTKDIKTLIRCPIGNPISNLHIDNRVTRIEQFAFLDCHKLKEINIPSNVASIGDSAFCTSETLSAIKVHPNNRHFVSIHGILFTKDMKTLICFPPRNSIANYEIPVGVTSIHDNAFQYSRLTNVTIPSTVTSIGNSAFFYCVDLKCITIPSSVTSIGNEAFRECCSLFLLKLSVGITSIGKNSFLNCNSLNKITIPSSVTSIGDCSFAMCHDLREINVESSNSNYMSIDGVLFTKDGQTLIEYPTKKTSSLYEIPSTVTSIGSDAFIACSQLRRVVIPSSVTSLGESSFSYCSLLSEITIPTSVTTIGNHSFCFCSNLTSIELPSSITAIEDSLFQNCFRLSKIKIPSSVVTIGNSAFSGCSVLADITIPSGVQSIGGNAFFCCNDLTKIEIPSTVLSIGDLAFDKCPKLTDVIVEPNNPNYASIDGVLFTKNINRIIHFPIKKNSLVYNIPSPVTSIEQYAFTNCSLLTTITLPPNLLNIGNRAFAYCYELTEIKIPSSVTSIEKYAFTDIWKLKNIIVDTNNTKYASINGVLFTKNIQRLICFPGAKEISHYQIPFTVTSIENMAFCRCNNLTSIIIPPSVTSIGDSAFYFSKKLASINIPSSVKYIGRSAFEYCASLKSIAIDSDVASIGDLAFNTWSNVNTITVPFISDINSFVEQTDMSYEISKLSCS